MQPAVFVATNGFKVLAFDNLGRRRWENLVRYHKQTKIRAVKETGRLFVVVGTAYSTPVNVFDGATGRALWHAWEQMGDEMKSTTDYCGLHLTDMLFLDADRDGSMEVVFGTKYSRVYALRLKDGATVWQANVGDEVRCLRSFVDPGSGEDRVAAGTAAGDVILLDRLGRRLARVALASPVAGLEVLPSPEGGSAGLLAASDDGRVLAFDARLDVLGSFDLGRGLRSAAPFGARDGRPVFLLLAERSLHQISYIASGTRTSRVH